MDHLRLRLGIVIGQIPLSRRDANVAGNRLRAIRRERAITRFIVHCKMNMRAGMGRACRASDEAGVADVAQRLTLHDGIANRNRNRPGDHMSVARHDMAIVHNKDLRPVTAAVTTLRRKDHLTILRRNHHFPVDITTIL